MQKSVGMAVFSCRIGNFVSYTIKMLRKDAHSHVRKMLLCNRARRAKCSSPSRLRGWGVDVGLPTLFYRAQAALGGLKIQNHIMKHI